jgi:RHS repeat-associated protein
MPMPLRSYTGENYRFGFNGQEKTDEIAGAGNHYTAEFWEYSPRVVHRWNQDPIQFPALSPYAINFNNPIVYTDPNGDVGGRFESKKDAKEKRKSGEYGSVDRYKKDGYWHVTTSKNGTQSVYTENGDVNLTHKKFGMGKMDGYSLSQKYNVAKWDFDDYAVPQTVKNEIEALQIGGNYALENSKLAQGGQALSFFIMDAGAPKNIADIAFGKNVITGEDFNTTDDYVWAGFGALGGGVYIRLRGLKGLGELAYVGKTKEFAKRYASSIPITPVLRKVDESVIIRAFEQHALDYVEKVKNLPVDNMRNPLNMNKYKDVYDDILKNNQKN